MKKYLAIIMMMLMVLSVAATAPVLDLNSIDPTSVNEGESVVIDLEDYVTYNGDKSADLTYEVSPSSPGTLVGSVWTFDTEFDDSGSYDMTFKAINDTDESADTVTIDVVDVPASLEVSTILIGDESQPRGEEATTTFTIKNTGGDAITGVSVSATSSDADAELVIVSVSGSSIAPGAEVTVNIKGFIPLDLDAVNSNGEKVSIKVGTITVSSSVSDKTADVDMEAENNLVIKDMDLFIDGDKEGIDNEDEVTDIKPGVEIEAVVEIDNRFDDTGDCDTDGTDCEIEDIEVTIIIDDGDLDIDEDIDFGDLKADDDDSDSVTFDLDDDIDEDTYKMEISLTGDDENGARHGEYWEVTLDVEKERDEITIYDMTLNPSTVSCNNGNEFSLRIDAENTGRDDQKKVVLTIRSSKLDIFDKTLPFKLDENDDITKTLDFEVPKDTNPGTYYVEVTSYYDIDEESEIELLQIVVPDCDAIEEEEEEEPEEDDNIVYVDPDEFPEVPGEGVIIGQPDEEASKGDVFSSETYIVLLVVGILIVLLLMVKVLFI